MLTPYQYASNSPIAMVDIDGLEGGWSNSTHVEQKKRYGESVIGKWERKQAAAAVINKTPTAQLPRQVTRTTVGPETRPRDVARQSSEQFQREYKFSQEMEKRAAADPISYGGPGFGQGLVRDPLIQASATTVCPGCGVAVGGLTTYVGISEGKPGLVVQGGLMMLGGGMTLYSQFAKGSAGAQLAEMEASSGGHFLSRHGAQTSLSSQYQRAISGMTPEGVVLKEVDASRFLSHEFQLEAAKMAQSRNMITGESAFNFSMGKTIGEGYLKGGGAGSYMTTQTVRAIFKDGKLQTLFPLLR